MILHVLQIVAALVVLSEALNKLHRTDAFDGRRGLKPRLMALAWLFAPWRWQRRHIETTLKVLAWVAFSLAAAGEFVAPPTIHGTAAVVGMALLIVRQRMKEG